jgi:hypothetical protein
MEKLKGQNDSCVLAIVTLGFGVLGVFWLKNGNRNGGRGVSLLGMERYVYIGQGVECRHGPKT